MWSLMNFDDLHEFSSRFDRFFLTKWPLFNKIIFHHSLRKWSLWFLTVSFVTSELLTSTKEKTTCKRVISLKLTKRLYDKVFRIEVSMLFWCDCSLLSFNIFILQFFHAVFSNKWQLSEEMTKKTTPQKSRQNEWSFLPVKFLKDRL